MTAAPLRILHILSQRPGRTGSGVFLQAMVREAAARGHEQHVVLGGPPDTSADDLRPLPAGQLSVVPFPGPGRDFNVPGMSDVMPYPSTVYSGMTDRQVEAYRAAFHEAFAVAKREFDPDIVHAHHLWIATALAREVFDDRPVVATAHGTGLRQLEKAARLTSLVLPGIRALDRIGTLTEASSRDTIEAYGVEPRRLRVTGAGFRADLFHPAPQSREALDGELAGLGIRLPAGARRIVYVGRLSSAKGIPWLLRALPRMKEQGCKLILVGAKGSGEDGARNLHLVREAGDRVVHVGAQPQEIVAKILQAADLFTLPSLYEGLPLVMLEAMACGARAVVSALPTLESWAPRDWLDADWLTLVPKLATTGTDTPVPQDEERFTRDLAAALDAGLRAPRDNGDSARQAEALRGHSWAAVFQRYEAMYRELLDSRLV